MVSVDKFRYSVLLVLLVAPLLLNAQTNNFFLNSNYYGYKYNKAGNALIRLDINTASYCNFGAYSSGYGISDWQGNPRFYLFGCTVYKHPENQAIDNGDSVAGIVWNDAFMHYDTSNYLMFNMVDTSKGAMGGFAYNKIVANSQSAIGYEIPANGKNRLLPPYHSVVRGTAATKDSMGQPVFVSRTTQGFYSYKTLPGGDVVLMDSFPLKPFMFTPDSILQKQGSWGSYITKEDYAIIPVKLNHCGNKIVCGYTYTTRLFGTQIVIENYSIVYTLDFDKHTGKFSNLKSVYFHKFDPYAAVKDKEYFVPYQAAFSLNDSVLYMAGMWNEYDDRVFTFSVPQSTLYYKSIKNSLVQLNMVDNAMHELSAMTGSASNIHYNLQYNNTGDILLWSDTTTESGWYYEAAKINNPNSLSYNNKILRNYLPRIEVLLGKEMFYPLLSSPYYTFLRTEQTVNYSCSSTVQILNTTLPDIGFTKYKWHIRDEQDSLRVYEQFEPPLLHYTRDGNYAVQLFAQSPKGGGYAEWYIDTIRIRIPKKPVARFRALESTVCLHFPVTFINQSFSAAVNPSKPQRYLWDFGDGTTSNEINPVHEYAQPGVYTVRLLFDNGYCDSLLEKTDYIRVIDAPKGGFDITPVQGCAPLLVTITDTTWAKVDHKEYYFGDIAQWQSVNTSSFTHMFTQAGIYKVIQKLYAESGCIITTDSAFVAVSAGLTIRDTFNLWLSDVSHTGISLRWHGKTAAVKYRVYAGVTPGGLSMLAETTDTFYHDIRQPVFPYYYAVQGVDSCGTQGITGYQSHPAWLSGKVIGNNEAAELRFTDYTVWSGSELEYNLQKLTSEGWKTIVHTPISGTLSDPTFLMEDSLQSCYRILLTDPWHTELVSHSNEVCLDYIPLLYIPNAFSPNGDGLNDVLGITTFGIRSYRLEIYNRWGAKVFSGNNSGWDGMYEGIPAPMGVYTLYLRYTTKEGKEYETKNTVQLLR
ncbi:MAG: gliding motility-associated C-terminal domain-containing protein [Bacteroidia bacterium]|nr:gliding motility-associated C-terminal domain-containing protein [Bacteroidia bacterium]